jgi:tRNA (guanine6-N2)-methyltransferase
MDALYMVTTNAGLEHIVEAEIRAAASSLDPPIGATDVEVRPNGCFGRVLLRRAGSAVEPAIEKLLLGLRGVHDVMRHYMTLPLPDGGPLALYELLRAMPLGDGGGPAPPLLGGGSSFRVSCVREGAHEFTSLDIEREAGGALHELYGAPASMKQFDVRVRVDVAKQTVLVGVALNRAPLSHRHKLAFTRSVTLKPNVAYALLRLAGLCDGSGVLGGGAAGDVPCTRRVLDPCCGSGTIALEAAEALGLSAVGTDKSLAVVRGATANATAAGLEARCTFEQANCRSLSSSFPPDSFDAIVSNLPCGAMAHTKCTHSQSMHSSH